MNKFEGKTEEEAVKRACKELGIEDPKRLNYQVISVKKSLFNSTVTIGIYTVTDVIVFADDYIRRCLKALGLEGMTEAKYDDGVIKLNIVCNRNKNVIGRNGDTLRSINELTRSACFNRFGGHYRILLNCDGYKESKYDKFVAIARRYADEVCRTHITAIMDPMTSDERRIIHQALSDYPNIKTQSLGTGHKRHITIQYTGPEN
ncbi:MAG TPA: Jag N-terminal domain-containing protein [Candidatus Enterosoma merdigallinarum]|nr:Jag N-terminal domain-containing protein [Candidatus Enterosoma merdigallinarum]